jgi:hypothetical protein
MALRERQFAILGEELRIGCVIPGVQAADVLGEQIANLLAIFQLL